MKKLSRILLIIIVVIFGALIAKNIIIEKAVESGALLVTGLKLDIGSINVGVFKPVVDIKNLRLFNPSNFPDKTMVDMPQIHVKYDLPSIIGGKLHLPEVTLALKEFVVVKNAKGELNLDALKNVQSQKDSKSSSKKTSQSKTPQIKIDVLKLSIAKVIYKDYSKGSTPDVKEFNVNLNETYTNVDNPQMLASLIVVKALMNTSIASLTNFDVKGLQGAMGGVLEGTQKMASSAVNAAKDILKNPFGSGK